MPCAPSRSRVPAAAHRRLPSGSPFRHTRLGSTHTNLRNTPGRHREEIVRVRLQGEPPPQPSPAALTRCAALRGAYASALAGEGANPRTCGRDPWCRNAAARQPRHATARTDVRPVRCRLASLHLRRVRGAGRDEKDIQMTSRTIGECTQFILRQDSEQPTVSDVTNRK